MRRLILASALAPLALVAACDPQPTEPVEPPKPEVILGGVNLGEPVRLLGTEPFWSVDITADTLKYEGGDRPVQTAANPGPTLQGTMAVFTATTDKNVALEITLIDTDCSDGMSDRLYPLTARVKIGEETLSGCAASTAAIMAGGESGPVQTETPAETPSPAAQ